MKQVYRVFHRHILPLIVIIAFLWACMRSTEYYTRADSQLFSETFVYIK